MHNWDNLIFVGMPGSGKSAVGVRVARELGYDFVDGDRVLEAREGKTLKEIIEAVGNDGFGIAETEALCSINTHRSVIAPGGSVCYEEPALKHFHEIGTVVYLEVGLRELTYRLGDLHARGVVLKPGFTLGDLYNERVPLYEACADVTIHEGKDTIGKTVQTICRMVRSEVGNKENDTD